MAGEKFDWDDDDVTTDPSIQRKMLTLPRRTSCLEQVEGPGAPLEFVLTGERMVVGRAADADIRILSTSISRHHMLVQRTGPEHICRDLDSRNGIYLNGIKIHSVVLRDGDHIQIGDVLLVYQYRKR